MSRVQQFQSYKMDQPSEQQQQQQSDSNTIMIFAGQQQQPQPDYPTQQFQPDPNFQQINRMQPLQPLQPMQQMPQMPQIQSMPPMQLDQYGQPQGYWQQPPPDSFMISFNTVGAPAAEKKHKKSKKSRKHRNQEMQEPQPFEDGNMITSSQAMISQTHLQSMQLCGTQLLSAPQFTMDQSVTNPLFSQQFQPQAQIMPRFDEPLVEQNQMEPQFNAPAFGIQAYHAPFPMQTIPEGSVNELNEPNQEMHFIPATQESFIQINMPSQPLMIVPQGPFQPEFIKPVSTEAKEKRINLMKLYILKKRQLALQLDPDLCRYQGQVTFELQLSEELLKKKVFDKLEKYTLQGFTKIHLEAKFSVKQAQIINAILLDETETGVKTKTLALKDTGLNLPEDQASIQEKRFVGQSRNVYQYEQTVRSDFVTALKQGTSQLNKKLFSIKLRKATEVNKYKPTYKLVVSFFCDQITDVGGIRMVKYQRDRETRLNNQTKTGAYFFTNDHCTQSEAWLPRIIGTQNTPTPWSLKFIVPKEYMLVASGKQLLREVDSEGFALHEYELNAEEQTIPDKIGFIALPFPEITNVEVPRSAGGKTPGKVYACFVSKTKQQNLSPKLIPDILDYLASIVMKPYPCRETQLVFVPNLFPYKHPQQALNFAGGLHILDQEILFKPTQIDKRHHSYKHLTSALAFDYFGNVVREGVPSDTWLLVAIRERLGDRFKKKRCGTLLYRYQIMRSIEKIYKQMKQGLETAPLQRAKTQSNEDEPDEVYRLGAPHPAELSLSDIFFRKCSLIMHMIESNIDETNLDKIFREMYYDALQSAPGLRLIDQLSFRRKFRKVCGMQPQTVFTNWIWSTSCPKLELSYKFNKRNNSLDLQLKQTSAASFNMKGRKQLEMKLSKIFGLTNTAISKELYAELPSGLDTFYVDELQAQRRWFVGDINIVIYQVEGSGGDILKQQHKMQLKDNKTIVSAHIPLQGRVKRTMPTKKKEFDMLPFADDSQQQTVNNLQMQAAQIVLNNDVWKFEMNEFELEDFPQETKNLFTTRELENNPVLWIRVDPDMEFIRQVKVIQDKKVHWLFQLLRETDIIGQIEAVNQLHKYNSELVYEILKTVSKNENYFFKVRKCVLQAMQKMEVSQINKWLSHEAFLIRAFNKKNFDEETSFYKVNNFTNLLEYYLDRSMIKAISKCKEEKLKLKAEKELELQELRRQRDKSDASIFEGDQTTENKVETENASATIQLNIIDNQLVNVTTRPAKRPKLIDENLYRVTSDAVAKMLIKVLEQNDNSENSFDDSFLIRDMMAALGRLDNVALMPKIALEIQRQFKLDQISNSSPWHAITIGAIAGCFNMLKQIWRMRELKLPNVDASDKFAIEQAEALARTEQILEGFKTEINGLLADPDQSLNLRLFIFTKQVKNLIFYRNLPLVKALQAVLDAIYGLQAKLQIRFAHFCIRELAMLLESQKFVGKLNFTELFIESACTRKLMDTLWRFICLPHGYLTHELTYWTKRIIHRIYGPSLPDFLQKPSSSTAPTADYIWSSTEQKLQHDEQYRLAQKEQFKAQPSFGGGGDEIILENIAFEPKSPYIKRSGLRSNINEIIVTTTDELMGGEQRLHRMMDERHPQASNIDFYQQGPLGDFVINVGDTSTPVYQEGLITLSAVANTKARRDRYNSDGGDSLMYDESKGLVKDSNDMIEISKGQHSDYGEQDDSEDIQESEYDPFAEIKFDDPLVQACWIILGDLYYHFDATDFLEPVSAKTIGYQLYQEYRQQIKHPMDISTIMHKMQTNAYGGDMSQFIADVELIFDNCREFNEQGTEIVNCANILTEFFKQQLINKGLIS